MVLNTDGRIYLLAERSTGTYLLPQITSRIHFRRKHLKLNLIFRHKYQNYPPTLRHLALNLLVVCLAILV